MIAGIVVYTELIHVTRRKDSVMRTVELWQRCFSLLWRCECSLPGVFGTSVLNVRVNFHKYKMKLLLGAVQ